MKTNKYGLILDSDKILNEKNKYKFRCKCGHYVIIYPFERYQRKLCDWCGNYIYANKKEEFKEKLMEVINNGYQ